VLLIPSFVQRVKKIVCALDGVTKVIVEGTVKLVKRFVVQKNELTAKTNNVSFKRPWKHVNKLF